jgi:hypothetical protein
MGSPLYPVNLAQFTHILGPFFRPESLCIKILSTILWSQSSNFGNKLALQFRTSITSYFMTIQDIIQNYNIISLGHE